MSKKRSLDEIFNETVGSSQTTSSGSKKSIDDIFNETVNKPATGLSSSQTGMFGEKISTDKGLDSFDLDEQKVQDYADRFLDKDSSEGEREHVKELIRNIKVGKVTPEEVAHTIMAMNKKFSLPEFVTKYGWTPWLSGAAEDVLKKSGGIHEYYMKDNKYGLKVAVPLKAGEKAPKDSDPVSMWGNQYEAEDDTRGTDFFKHIANIVPEVKEDLISLEHSLTYGMWTGKEAEWYKEFKDTNEKSKFLAGSKYQKGVVKSENIHGFSDLLKSENYDFTSDNLMNTGTSVVTSMIKFLLTRGILGPAGSGGIAFAKNFIAGYLNNYNSTLQEMENAGLEGKSKYITALAATIPISLVESKLGIESKFFKSAEAAAEKSNLISTLAKGFVKDTEGNITKESLNEFYDVASKASTAFGKRILKTYGKDIAEETGEEIAQNIITKSSMWLADKINADDPTAAKTGVNPFSAKSIADYIEDGIGGFIGGAGGSVVQKHKKQTESIVSALEKGDAGINGLYAELDLAKRNGSITERDYDLAKQKIETYKEYHEATKQDGYTPEEKKELFAVTYQKQNLTESIKELEEKNPGGINDGKIKSMKDSLKVLEASQKKISDSKNHLAEKEEKKPTEKPVAKEEKKTEEPVVTPTKLSIKVGAKEQKTEDVQEKKEEIKTPEKTETTKLDKPIVSKADETAEKIHGRITKLKSENRGHKLELEERSKKASVEKIDDIEYPEKFSEEWINEERKKDAHFKSFYDVHDSIAAMPDSDNKMRTNSQQEAVQNLKDANILKENEFATESMYDASVAINEGVKRIHWLKSNLTDSVEDKKQAENLNNVLKNLRAIQGIGKSMESKSNRISMHEQVLGEFDEKQAKQMSEKATKRKRQLEVDIAERKKKIESEGNKKTKKGLALGLSEMKSEVEDMDLILKRIEEKHPAQKVQEKKKEEAKKKKKEKKKTEKKQKVQENKVDKNKQLEEERLQEKKKLAEEMVEGDIATEKALNEAKNQRDIKQIPKEEWKEMDDESKFDKLYAYMKERKAPLKVKIVPTPSGQREVHLPDGRVVKFHSLSKLKNEPVYGQNGLTPQDAKIVLKDFKLENGTVIPALEVQNFTSDESKKHIGYVKYSQTGKGRTEKVAAPEPTKENRVEKILRSLLQMEGKLSEEIEADLKKLMGGGKAYSVTPFTLIAQLPRTVKTTIYLGLKGIVLGTRKIVEVVQEIRSAMKSTRGITREDKRAVEKLTKRIVELYNQGEIEDASELNKQVESILKQKTKSLATQQAKKIEEDDASKVFSSGEEKMKAVIGKIRHVYAGISEFGKDENTEAMIAFIAQQPNFINGKPILADLKAGLEKLFDQGYDQGDSQKIALAERLLDHLDKTDKEGNNIGESEVESVFTTFGSVVNRPYIMGYQDKTFSVRSINEGTSKSIREKAIEVLSDLTQEKYDTITKDLFSKTTNANNNIKQEKNEERKYEKIRLLLDFQNKAVSELTGIPISVLEKFNEAFNPGEDYVKVYSKMIDNSKDIFHRGKSGLANSRVFLNFKGPVVNKSGVIYDNVEQFKQHILSGTGTGTGGFINAIEQKVKEKGAVVSSFVTPAGKRKSSGEFVSHLTMRQKEVKSAASREYYKDNTFVQHNAKNGEVDVVMIAGIADKRTEDEADSKGLYNADLTKIQAKLYKDGIGSYYQISQQYGDKDRVDAFSSPKYASNEEAEKKLRSVLKKANAEMKLDINMDDQIKQIKEDWKNMPAYALEQLGNIICEGSDFEVRKGQMELFLMNFAINQIESFQFFNGKLSDYGKKGKMIIEDIIKRGGSMASPGIILNKHKKDGIGDGFKQVVISGPEIEGITLPDGTKIKDKFKGTDGGSFILRSLSDRIKLSSGRLLNFHTGIKAITSFVDGESRFLDKTYSVVVDDLAEAELNQMKEKNPAIPADATIDSLEITEEILKDLPVNALYQIMKKTGTDKISTNEGTKKLGGKSEYRLYEGSDMSWEMFKKAFDKKTLEAHTHFIKTENYLVQQDLIREDGGRLKEGNIPIQLVKNMMEFVDQAEITAKAYNKIADQRISKTKKEITELTPEEKQKFGSVEGKIRHNLRVYAKMIIAAKEDGEEEFEDVSDETDLVAQLLKENAPLVHPAINKWVQTFLANKIKKEALLRYTNKALAVELGNLNFDLKDTRVVNGKVVMGDVMVPHAANVRLPETFSFEKNAEKEIKEFLTKNNYKYLDLFDYDGNEDAYGDIRWHEIEINKENKTFTIPGELVRYTRIPADAPHSTTFARVKAKLPKGLMNHIVTPQATQLIAGSDNDGDQRTIEGLFKSKEKIKDDQTSEGIANKAFLTDAMVYYNAKNIESLVKPIDTGVYDKYVEHFRESSVKTPGLFSRYLKSRQDNIVGGKVIGAMANMQAVFDYLKAHNSSLKNEISFPEVDVNRNLKKNKSVKEFIKGHVLKSKLGNFMNLALDNGKDPKIEALGLNEVTVNMFSAAMMLTNDEESVITFFNHPIVKEYVSTYREYSSPTSDKDPNEAWKSLVELIQGRVGGASLFNDKGFIDFPKGDVVLTAEDLLDDNSFNVLSKLKQLEGIGFDMMKIQNVIKSTEEAPKNYAEYYNRVNNYNSLMNNELKSIDVSEFSNYKKTGKISPFVELAKKNLYEISNEVMASVAIEATSLAADVIERFEKEKSFGKSTDKKLSKNEIEMVCKALQSMFLNMSRQYNGRFETLKQNVFTAFEKNQEKFADVFGMMELKKDKNGNAIQLQLKENWKRNEIPEKILQKAKLDFERMMKEDPSMFKSMLDYLTFQYGFSTSKFAGSFVELLPISAHLQFGEELEKEKEKWVENEYPESVTERIIKEIMDKNPDLSTGKSEDNVKQKKEFVVYNPIFNEEKVLNFAKVETLQNIEKTNRWAINAGADTSNLSEEAKKKREASIELVKNLKPGTVVTMNVDGTTLVRTVSSVKVSGMNYTVNFEGKSEIVNSSKMENNQNEPLKPKDYTNHSGGAIGADSAWDKIGNEFGVTEHKHYYHGNKTPKGNVELTQEQVNEGIEKAKKAAQILGRPWNDKYASLLGRNWYQVKNSDAVFAVAPIVNPGEKSSSGFTVKAKKQTVDGGTGYAVEMAIESGKPVYVFDTKTNQWKTWNGTSYEVIETPVLTKNFAGIGSRQDAGKMTEESKNAIREVYEKTFGGISLWEKHKDAILHKHPDMTEEKFNAMPEKLQKQLIKCL